jgi:ABC-type enterochelin transport system substrate-binding protein
MSNYISTYARKMGVKSDRKHWHEHVPKWVETSQEDKVTILWNQQAQTYTTIPNNKPDIIISDNEMLHVCW